MTSLGESAAPEDRTPGTWHPDPLGSGKERKWDGQAWSSEVRVSKAPPQAPPASPAVSAAAPTEQMGAASPPTVPSGGSAPTPPTSNPPTANQPAGNDGFRKWVRERPVWAVVIAAGAACVIGMILGAIGQSSEISDKDQQIAALETKVDGLEENEEDLNGQLADAEAEVDEVVGKALDVKADAKAQAAKVKAQAAKVAAREAKVSAAEETIKQNSFGDGVWHVGVDFDPGIYRSTSGDCYWEKLSEPGGGFDAIIDNGSGPNQTVTIDSEWFSASYCGKWQKIG